MKKIFAFSPLKLEPQGIMKSISFSRLIVGLYMHFWYVPLFLFLLGVKICFLSLLLTSTTNNKKSLILMSFEPGSGNLDEEISNFKLLSSSQGKGKALVTSQRYQHHHAKNHHKERQVAKRAVMINSKANKKKRKKSEAFSSSSTPSPQMLEEWDLLAHLDDVHMRPTHANRTDGNSIWLLYNSVPSFGSELFVKLLDLLSSQNGFAHQTHEYRTPWPRFLLDQEQESLVTWFEYQHLPKSYDRHFFHINFTHHQKFTKERPIYVNLLRDPVLRLEELYLSRRMKDKSLANMEIKRRNNEQSGSGYKWYEMKFEDCVLRDEEECQYESGNLDFTLSIPFFCGQHNSCVVINDKWGLQMAKFTLERYYSVVGVVERMDQTLTVLENYVPKFFSGVEHFYEQLVEKEKRSNNTSDYDPHHEPASLNFNLNENENASQRMKKVRAILERKLFAEVDLYRFAQQRLSLQYAHVTSPHGSY